jgi:hypothetical protein
MVQEQDREFDNGSNGSNEDVSRESKRAKIRFRRSAAADTATTEPSTSTATRRRSTARIPEEKRTEVSVSDTGPENHKVRGHQPAIPDEQEEPKKRGRPSKRVYPTLEESNNNAKFLLSALEVACITRVGQRGEMTDWERGMMQAPLQRCIQRIPIDAVRKGGLFVDIGFLVMGGSMYFGRIMQGVEFNLPGKRQSRGVQEDTRAPVAAPVEQTVSTIKPGDRDGLAQPIPSYITQNMNGAI